MCQFFARNWEYKESLIKQNSYRNIYAILEDNERQDQRKREQRDMVCRIPKTVLLAGEGCDVNEEFLACLYLAGGDVLKADKIYKKADIVELFEKQAYKLSYEYIEPELRKGNNG